MESTKFKISGLTCGACAKIAQKRLLKNIAGIEKSEVTEKGEATVLADEKVSEDAINEALADTDFKFERFI